MAGMAETGSVTFMFDHVGVIAYPFARASEDAMLEAALEVGADEVSSSEDGHEFLTGGRLRRGARGAGG